MVMTEPVQVTLGLFGKSDSLAAGVFQNGWITSKETQEQIDTLHLTLLKYPNQIKV